MVKRIYVQKKEGFDIEAKGVLEDLKESLRLKGLQNVIILNRYDVEGLSREVFEKAKNTVFSEPQVDLCFEENYDFKKEDKVFAIEYLPGQFDQTANSLVECLQIIASGGIKPVARTAKVYILSGEISEEELKKIKSYLINSVDSREATLEKFDKLEDEAIIPEDVQVVEGFISMTDENVKEFYEKYGFAMDMADLKFCQKYFKEEEKEILPLPK